MKTMREQAVNAGRITVIFIFHLSVSFLAATAETEINGEPLMIFSVGTTSKIRGL